MISKNILVILGIAAVIFASFLIYTNKQRAERTEEIKLAIENINEQQAVEMTDEYGSDITTDPGVMIAELEDVTGGESAGTAYILRRNNKLYHFIEASLPTPDEGQYYEGWLVQKSPELKFFSTGEVILTQEDIPYELKYISDMSYEGYDHVVITLETERDDIPEEHIIEGTAK